MQNGDRVSGRVIRKTRDNLQLKTTYAGLLTIEWAQVTELRTERPVDVVLSDGSVHLVRFVHVGDNKIVLGQAPAEALNEHVEVNVWSIGRQSRPRKKGQLFGRVDIALKSERGNGDTDNFDFDIDATYRRQHDRWRVLGAWEVDTVQGFDEKRKWKIYGTYNHFLSQKLYIAGWVNFNHDKLADLNQRVAVGPFLGYQFFDSEKMNLSAEGGVVYVNEDYIGQPDDSFTQPAWNLNFDKYLNKDSLQFYHEQRGTANFGSSKWLWESWTGFRLPISGGFLGSVEAKLEYNGEPANLADTTETTYRFKLGYRW